MFSGARAALVAGLVLLGCDGPAPPPAAVTNASEPAVATRSVLRGPDPVRPLRVILGGDLLPHRPSLVAPASIGTALAPLSALFAQADAVVANYEAATGEVDHRTDRLAYAAPPGWLGALAKAGVGVVTVANNHACDLGEPGLRATLDEATASKVQVLGGDARDPWEPRIIAEEGGHKICAVAWTSISNKKGSCARGGRLAVAPLTSAGKQKVTDALARARAECDATVAIFHAGTEYLPQTSLVMDHAAHAAEAGADAVVIHHPHVASPVVVLKTRDGRDVPLFASVGNLVTNQGESWSAPMFPVLPENRRLVCVNGWTRLGVLADLTFSFGETGPHLDWGTHLVWTDNEHATNRSAATPKIAARLLDPAADHAIVEALSQDARGPRALFSDPCWLEHGGGRDPRCSTSAGMQGNAPPPVGAARRLARRRLSP
ncbi:MAG: Capsule biosynthesis protein capA [Labilithrix sp.]|nr:Capsule biosynthesis protein capA [Labilithrix sp.]